MCFLKELYNAIYEIVLPKKKGEGDNKGSKKKTLTSWNF